MRNMRASLLLFTALAAPLAAGSTVACGGRQGDIVAGVSDSAFARTMGDLQRVQMNGTLDSAGKAAARDSLLRQQKLTAVQLESAARALADQPERAALLFQAIQRRAGEQH
jgi:hypothetical protein